MLDFNLDAMLFQIPADKHEKIDLMKILKEHPEVQFVSMAGLDMVGNDTDERIPIRLFLEDMEDIGRYLYGSVEQLHDPRLLPDMDRAVEILGEKGSRIAISDVGVGILFAQAALEGASLNVFINTGLMKNAERACELNETANRLIAEGQAYKERIYAGVCVQLKS